MDNSKKINAWQSVLLVVNVLGILCLVFLTISYFKFDMEITNPNSMLPMTQTEGSGILLVIGFLPLLAANILGFIFTKTIFKKARLLFFLPSLICLAVIVHFLFFGPAAITLNSNDEPEDVFSVTIKMNVDEPIYGAECVYGINGNELGSMATTDAKFTEYDDDFYFGFSELMLENASDYSDFYIEVSFFNTEEEARTSAATMEIQTNEPDITLTRDMKAGDSLTYILTKDGDNYILTPA